jgi:hypothetical protein
VPLARGDSDLREEGLRFTLRPLNPEGLQLIKEIEQVLPGFVSEREADVYAADRHELEAALSNLSPNWPRLVDVESGEGIEPTDELSGTGEG